MSTKALVAAGHITEDDATNLENWELTICEFLARTQPMDSISLLRDYRVLVRRVYSGQMTLGEAVAMIEDDKGWRL